MFSLTRQRLLSRAGFVSTLSFSGRRSSLAAGTCTVLTLSIRGVIAWPTPFQPATLLPQQRFMSSLEDHPSEQQLLAYELEDFKEKKWGWVIYRCTYGDDAAWERFKERVVQQTRDLLASPYQESPPPRSVVDGVDWTFVSDPALEGASRKALRERFRAWVAEDAPGPAASPLGTRSSRHTYFVQVDEASLRSVVDSEDPNAWSSGWVNLVRCAEGLDYNLSPENEAAQDEYKKELEDNGEECIPEDWIMLSAEGLSPSFYGGLGSDTQNWYTCYSQPPNIVCH